MIHPLKSEEIKSEEESCELWAKKFADDF